MSILNSLYMANQTSESERTLAAAAAAAAAPPALPPFPVHTELPHPSQRGPNGYLGAQCCLAGNEDELAIASLQHWQIVMLGQSNSMTMCIAC